MNPVGKIPPALIDAKLLKRVAQNTTVQHTISKSLFMTEFEKICTSILVFMKNYWLYIFIFVSIVGYIWYCYIQHKEKKKRMLENQQSAIPHNIEHYSQGEYICDNDQVRILQRPVPEYKHNDVNKKIRNMYLEELNPPPTHPPFKQRPCDSKHRLNVSRDIPKLHRGLPANIHETKINPTDYRKTTYPHRLPVPRQKLPTVYDTQYSNCHRQPQYENKIETMYGQPMGPMTPISQYVSKDPVNKYGDTFYDAPIKRPVDDSDEFDDQFYDNGCY